MPTVPLTGTGKGPVILTGSPTDGTAPAVFALIKQTISSIISWQPKFLILVIWNLVSSGARADSSSVRDALSMDRIGPKTANFSPRRVGPPNIFDIRRAAARQSKHGAHTATMRHAAALVDCLVPDGAAASIRVVIALHHRTFPK